MKELNFMEEKKKEMEENQKDADRKKKKNIIKILEDNGFPYLDFVKEGFKKEILFEILFEIFKEIDENKNLDKMIKNRQDEKKKSEKRGYNFFYNLFKECFEKDCSLILRKLLLKLDKKKYFNIGFDFKGNLINLETGEYNLEIEKSELLIKMNENVNRIEERIAEALMDISQSKRFKNIFYEKQFQSFSKDRKGTLEILIIFIYNRWHTKIYSSLNTLLSNLEKIKIEDKIDTDLIINNQKELLDFIYRNSKNKRDNDINEKLKKIFIFQNGNIKDYSVKKSYPIMNSDLKRIEAHFQGIFFNNLRYMGHKAKYYITLYRDNKFMMEITKIGENIVDEIETYLKNEKLLNNYLDYFFEKIIEKYNCFYTLKELKKMRIEKKINVFKSESIDKKNAYQNNASDYINKIYSLIKIPKEYLEKKSLFSKIIELIDNFNLKNNYHLLENTDIYVTSEKTPVLKDIDDFLLYSYNLYFDYEETKRRIAIYKELNDDINKYLQSFDIFYVNNLLKNE